MIMEHRETTLDETISDIRRGALLSSGVSLTVGAIVQAVVGIGAQLVLMRLLLPDAFGDFAIVLAGASLAQVVLSFRLNVSIIRVSDAELTADRKDRYRAALVWETVAAASVTLIWLTAFGLVSVYALILVAALAVGQWANQSVAFYERTLAYHRIVAVETGSQIVGHVCAVALILFGAGAASLYLRELVVALSRLAAFARIGALPLPRFRAPRWDELRALAIEARALWVDGMMEGGFARVIVLAAASVSGAHGAGIFSQSLRLAIVPHQFLSPVVVRMSTNLFSRIGDAAHRRQLLIRMTFATLALLSVAAGLTVIFAEPVVPLLLGEHWRPAARTIVAMIGVILFLSGFDLLRAYCVSQRRMRLVLAGRAAQYVIFFAAGLAAVRSDDPILILAVGLSLAYAGSFGLIAAGLAMGRPTSAPNGA
jgi:O-antigen/teichoic acid export membrane protein